MDIFEDIDAERLAGQQGYGPPHLREPGYPTGNGPRVAPPLGDVVAQLQRDLCIALDRITALEHAQSKVVPAVEAACQIGFEDGRAAAPAGVLWVDRNIAEKLQQESAP